MTEAQKLEQEIATLAVKLAELRKAEPDQDIQDYAFTTDGPDCNLSDLFGEHERLLMIHNMGQGCRYCTLWADGINGILPHLETAMSVVPVSYTHLTLPTIYPV